MIVLCLAISGASELQAKRLYKYQDDDGIWHYTDRKPGAEQDYEERLVEVEPSSPVTLRQQRGANGTTRYYFRNRRNGPVEVEVALSEATNVESTPALPSRFVLPRAGEEMFVEAGPADPRRGYKYRMSYNAIPGDPIAKPDPNYHYLVPFAAGKRHFISQAFNGQSTHSADQARHAVDIVLPEGTPVLAARGGIVMHIEQDFFGAGQKERYADRANHVRVLHDDGTMGLYAHLQHESIEVRPGQVVAPSEQLGRSGNTGFSTGPHLHFAIQRNGGMKLQTIPFVFRDGLGGSFEPAAGHWLEHRRGQVARLIPR